MNAAEARKLSNDNVPKLVEQNIKDSISHINNLIQITAKKGEFSINTQITLPANILELVVEKVVTHYQENDYETRVVDFGRSKNIFISWQK
jgi:hypothetical protein